ncbi:MAG: hypothetical protein IPH36_11955 [Saprospiraceae bacterium]|nr:hypothetical protein [Saprospiraceae bacterium]
MMVKTSLYHRPYGTGNFELVSGSEKLASGYQNWIDTSFVHKDINTLSTGHEYQLQFLIQASQAYGVVPTAGTLFLTITPGDQKNKLSWESKTPWANKLYTIFKETAPDLWLKIGKQG